MDYVLSYHLPPELVDIIAKMVWHKNIAKIHYELIHLTVWIRYKGELSVWVCKYNNNPYRILEDNAIWTKITYKHRNRGFLEF